MQHTQIMIQAVHIQYAAAPPPTYQDYIGRVYYGVNKNYRGRGGLGVQRQGNWRVGCCG